MGFFSLIGTSLSAAAVHIYMYIYITLVLISIERERVGYEVSLLLVGISFSVAKA